MVPGVCIDVRLAPSVAALLSTEALLSVNVLAVAACTLLPVERLMLEPGGANRPEHFEGGAPHSPKCSEQGKTNLLLSMFSVSVFRLFSGRRRGRWLLPIGSQRGRQGYGEMGCVPDRCPVL